MPSDDDAPGFARRSAFLLSQLGSYSAQRFVEKLAPLGIHPSHYGLLTHLRLAEGQSQQQIADALGIHRNVMVGLIDDLEGRGLVERRRHPKDRRAYAIHLTAEAHRLLPRAEELAGLHEDELLAGLDEGERSRLAGLLQKVAANAGARAGVHPGLGSGH